MRRFYFNTSEYAPREAKNVTRIPTYAKRMAEGSVRPRSWSRVTNSASPQTEASIPDRLRTRMDTAWLLTNHRLHRGKDRHVVMESAQGVCRRL